MKFKKKLCSLFLVLVLCLSNVSFVFADELPTLSTNTDAIEETNDSEITESTDDPTEEDLLKDEQLNNDTFEVNTHWVGAPNPSTSTDSKDIIIESAEDVQNLKNNSNAYWTFDENNNTLTYSGTTSPVSVTINGSTVENEYLDLQNIVFVEENDTQIDFTISGNITNATLILNENDIISEETALDNATITTTTDYEFSNITFTTKLTLSTAINTTVNVNNCTIDIDNYSYANVLVNAYGSVNYIDTILNNCYVKTYLFVDDTTHNINGCELNGSNFNYYNHRYNDSNSTMVTKVTVNMLDCISDSNVRSLVNNGGYDADFNEDGYNDYLCCNMYLSLENITATNCLYDILCMYQDYFYLMYVKNVNASTSVENNNFYGIYASCLRDSGAPYPDYTLYDKKLCKTTVSDDFLSQNIDVSGTQCIGSIIDCTFENFDVGICLNHTYDYDYNSSWNPNLNPTEYKTNTFINNCNFLNCGRIGAILYSPGSYNIHNSTFTGADSADVGIFTRVDCGMGSGEGDFYANKGDTLNLECFDTLDISHFKTGVYNFRVLNGFYIRNCNISDVNSGYIGISAITYIHNCKFTAKENPVHATNDMNPIEESVGIWQLYDDFNDYNMTTLRNPYVNSGVGNGHFSITDCDIKGFYRGYSDSICYRNDDDTEDTYIASSSPYKYIYGCLFENNIENGVCASCSGEIYNCKFTGDTHIMVQSHQAGANIYGCTFEGNGKNIAANSFYGYNVNTQVLSDMKGSTCYFFKPDYINHTSVPRYHQDLARDLSKSVNKINNFKIGLRGLGDGIFAFYGDTALTITNCETGLYDESISLNEYGYSWCYKNGLIINNCTTGIKSQYMKFEPYGGGDNVDNPSKDHPNIYISNCNTGYETITTTTVPVCMYAGAGYITIKDCNIGLNMDKVPVPNANLTNWTLINNKIALKSTDKANTYPLQFNGNVELNNNKVGIYYAESTNYHYMPAQFKSLVINGKQQAVNVDGMILVTNTFNALGISEYYLDMPYSYINIYAPYNEDNSSHIFIFDMPVEDIYEDTDNNPETEDEKVKDKGYFEGRQIAHTGVADYVNNMYTKDPHWIVVLKDNTTYDEILTEASMVTYDYKTNGGTELIDTDTITGTYKFISPTTELPVLTEDDTYKYKLGDSIHLTPKGVKEGYEFIGWNTDPNATVGLESLTATSGDITLYAIYKTTKPITYHTYDTTLDWTKDAVFYNNQDTINITLDDYSATVNSLYAFVGYILDNSSTDLADANLLAEGATCELSIDDLNIYSVYDTSCTLTYKDVDTTTEITTNEDTVRAVATNIVSAVFSFTVIDKENVTTGYTFEGWLDPVDEKIYQKDDTYTTSEHTATLIAKEAEILVVSVTVTPKVNDIYIGGNVQLTATVLPETALDKSIVWSSSDDNIATVDQTGKVTGLLPGTVTITATNQKSGKYDTATVNVNRLHAIYNYTYNGGTSMSDVEDVYYVPTNELDLTPTANKEGYTFIGWNTDKDATTALNSVVFEEEDITVYAIFKKDAVITYHTYNAENNYTDTVTFYNNETTKTKALKEYTAAVNDLYAFVGYVLNENETDFDNNLLSAGTNVTVSNTGLDVYCVYDTQSVLSYYDVDGQTFLSSDTKSMRAVAEAIIHQTFIFLTISKVPHEGYKFDGWIDSNNQLHESNTQYIITDHEATLIAKESEITAESLTVAPKVSEIYFGDNVQLTATLLPTTLVDKTLVWSTNNDYTTVTQDGLVTGVTPGTSTITVTHTASGLSDTATVKVKKLSLIYDYTTNGGTSMTDNDNTATTLYKPQMVANLTATAEKEGYTFVGWNTNKNATSGMTSVIFVDSDIKVYAIFRKNVDIKYHTYNTDLDYIDTVVFYNNQETVNTTLKDYVLDENDLYTFKGYILDKNSINLTNLKQSGNQITVPINGLDVYCVYETIGKLVYKDTDLSIIIIDNCKKQAIATNITNQTFTYTVRDKEPHAGYTFDGWLDDETLYQSNETYTTNEHSATLIAKESEILVTKVTVVPKVNEIYFNDTVQLTGTVIPETALDKTIVWTSENDDIATVNQNGLVTGHTLGNVTITATNPKSSKYDTASVTVKRLKANYNYTYNGGTSMTEIEDVWYKPNMELDLTPIVTKDGYEFVGWNTNKDATTGLDKLVFADSDITVYAIFKKNVNIKYHTYDTEKDYTDTITFYNKQSSIKTNLKQYPITENSIYNFIGYSLDIVKSDDIIEENSEITVTLDGLDVYCVYDVTGKLIYKDMNGKVLNTDTTIRRANALNIIDQMFTYTLRDKTATEGYTFNGWLDEDNKLHNSKEEFSTNKTEYVMTAKETLIPVEPERRKVTIQGILTYSDGTPIANKTITLNQLEENKTPMVASAPRGDMVNTLLANSNNDENISYTTITDEQGKYIFKNIYVGNYVLDIFDNTTKIAECNITVDVPEKDSVNVGDTKDNVDVSYKIDGNIFNIDATITNPEPEIPDDDPTTEEEPTTETPTTETTTEITTENTPIPAKVETPVVKTGDATPIALISSIMCISLFLLITLFITRKKKH